MSKETIQESTNIKTLYSALQKSKKISKCLHNKKAKKVKTFRTLGLVYSNHGQITI